MNLRHVLAKTKAVSAIVTCPLGSTMDMFPPSSSEVWAEAAMDVGTGDSCTLHRHRQSTIVTKETHMTVRDLICLYTTTVGSVCDIGR